jgi:hypothetical protein
MQRNNFKQAVWYSAAALSLGAAVLHAWVAPEHFQEWWGYGTFFAVAALVQGVFAVALLRTSWRWLIPVGIAGNLFFIAVYVLTRTAGVPPIGPHAGEVEPVGGVDVLSKLLELGVVLTLIPLWRMSPLGATARR